MKKIFYLFAIIGMTFASCTPLEDLHDEIDAIPDAPNVGSLEYTLVEDDYSALGLNFGNFSNSEDAKTMLPAFLATKYALYGKDSDVKVTFKLYSPKRDEKSLTVYTVSSADYAAGGHTYGNFDSSSQITAFLDRKFPDAPNRRLVSLTYKFYNGSTTTREDGFIKVEGVWEKSMGITDDEYKAMGEGRAQFSNHDEAIAKIPYLLDSKAAALLPEAGDIEGVMYKLYVKDTEDIDGDGRTDDSAVYSFVAFFIYDGANWSKYNNVIDSTIQFANDGSKWVPDNTIKYTFTDADYELVGNGRYGNFDVRSGKDEEQESVRIEKVNTVLSKNFPNAEEGQKFVVYYNVYDGANQVWSLALVKEGTKFVKQ